jgi:hypothetical protein
MSLFPIWFLPGAGPPAPVFGEYRLLISEQESAPLRKSGTGISSQNNYFVSFVRGYRHGAWKISSFEESSESGVSKAV